MPIIHTYSNVEETFPEGAYCPINSYNRPTDRAEWTSFAPNGLPYGAIVLYSTHHGVCLRERERNMRDDSDFYMLVWDAEKGAAHEIMFATTRGWSYPCFGSSVDATPEVVAAYEAWVAAAEAERRRQHRVAEIKRLRKLVRAMREAATANEVSYESLRKLYDFSYDQFAAAMWLLTAKVRSGFKLSLRSQLIAWLRDPAPKYRNPLSPGQLPYVQRYTGPGADPVLARRYQ